MRSKLGGRKVNYTDFAWLEVLQTITYNYHGTIKCTASPEINVTSIVTLAFLLL